jgi:hypothetical protein
MPTGATVAALTIAAARDFAVAIDYRYTRMRDTTFTSGSALAEPRLGGRRVRSSSSKGTEDGSLRSCTAHCRRDLTRRPATSLKNDAPGGAHRKRRVRPAAERRSGAVLD